MYTRVCKVCHVAVLRPHVSLYNWLKCEICGYCEQEHMARPINQAGLDLIKKFEGCRLTAYQDQVGVWTIGYGSTSGVKPGMAITQEQADDRLRQDLETAEIGVGKYIKVSLNDNQFAALVSLCFNVGIGNLINRPMFNLINQGQYSKAADHFLLYNKAGGVPNAALTDRRKAERALFLS